MGQAFWQWILNLFRVGEHRRDFTAITNGFRGINDELRKELRAMQMRIETLDFAMDSLNSKYNQLVIDHEDCRRENEDLKRRVKELEDARGKS